MLKSLFIKVIRLVALTLLIVQFTFSSALANSQFSKPPETPKNNMPTSESQNSSASESQNSSVSESQNPQPTVEDLVERLLHTSPQAAQPYNMEVIQQFNEEVYGSEEAF